MDWDKIIIDRMSISVPDALALTRRAMTIGIDVGGDGRSYCSFCIDTLPRIDGKPGNIYDAGLLDLPDWRAVPKTSAGRILVSFGGEDPGHLTEPTCRLLAQILGPDAEITAVSPRPAELERLQLSSSVQVVGPVPSLVPMMEQHEWVVTAFGLTALEARAMGRRVITVAPTRYHDSLARIAGFTRCGIGSPQKRALRRALRTRDDGESVHEAAAGVSSESLAQVVQSLRIPERRGSVAAAGVFGSAVWRGKAKTYFSCPETGLIYMERFTADEETYGNAYFMDEYRSQYGRTYLEDFDHIKAMGESRTKEIKAILPEASAVLDVGCAYGPFLAACSDVGMVPYGTDISVEAVEYVSQSLGFPAVAGNVLEVDAPAVLGVAAFDVVTLWYVIEHFQELDAVLGRISRWIRPGGVLALSTPNGAGVSGRRNPELFFEQSPRDHFSIWTRQSAKKTLARYGFEIQKIVGTGHHPERYPGVRKRAVPQSLARMHSKMFGWGDTFEIYAVKTEKS